MTNSVNLGRTSLSDYDVFWGTYAFGAVDKVDPDLKLVTKPIKVGTLGDINAGLRIIGLEGSVKVEAREIDLTALRTLMAWNQGSASASIPLVPATFHQDLYSYAALLTLHPIAMGTNTTRDLNLTKAVPLMPKIEGEKDGVKDDVMPVEFIFFPDRAKLLQTPPVIDYGSIGP